MNPEPSLSEIEKHENVKERLNNLIHKKILDQNEKLHDNSNKSNDSLEEKPKNLEYIYQQGESSSEPLVEIAETFEEELTNNSEEDVYQYLLHHILNDKKKALLKNKDVVNFLQNKLKFNQ